MELRPRAMWLLARRRARRSTVVVRSGIVG